jgi:two-component sensor histidine kinase
MRQGFLSWLWEGGTSTPAQIAHLALEVGGMGAWALDVDRQTVRGTGEVAEFFDLPEDREDHPVQAFFDALHPDDVATVRTALEATSNDGVAFHVRYRVVMPGRPERWVGVSARVTETDPDGRPRTITGIIWDETESVRREAELRRLSEEMDHHVKNAFATIRALVNLGTRAETDMAGFADTMRAEVQALADMHDLTARAAERGEAGVRLDVILRGALEANALGPADMPPNAAGIMLDGRRASAMAMILYQLAATARQGRTAPPEVAVDLTRGGDTARIVWTERLEGSPTREGPAGFGTLLLEQCASTLQGALHRERLHDGVRVELEFPL